MSRVARIVAVSAIAMLVSLSASAQGDYCNGFYFEEMYAQALEPGDCITWTIDCTDSFANASDPGVTVYYDFGDGNGPVALSGAPGMRVRYNGKFQLGNVATVEVCNLSHRVDCPDCGASGGQGSSLRQGNSPPARSAPASNADSDTDSDTTDSASCPATQDCTGRGFDYFVHGTGMCTGSCSGLKGQKATKSLAFGGSFGTVHLATDGPTAWVP